MLNRWILFICYSKYRRWGFKFAFMYWTSDELYRFEPRRLKRNIKIWDWYSHQLLAIFRWIRSSWIGCNCWSWSCCISWSRCFSRSWGCSFSLSRSWSILLLSIIILLLLLLRAIRIWRTSRSKYKHSYCATKFRKRNS